MQPTSKKYKKLRGFLFSLVISLAWLSLARWFFTSVAFVSFLFYAFGNGSLKVDGVKGSLIHGFDFDRLEDKNESRTLTIEGFHIRYVDILAKALRREPALDQLKIANVEFEEIRLEKPTVSQFRDDLLKAIVAIEGIKLGGGGLRSVTIGLLEITSVTYRPALGAPPLKIGPVTIENFQLTQQGWEAGKFMVGGEQIQLHVQSRDERSHPDLQAHTPEQRPRAIIQARIVPEFFADASGPFTFSNE